MNKFTCRHCFSVEAEEGDECESSPTGLHAPKAYHLPGEHDQQSHAGNSSNANDATRPATRRQGSMVPAAKPIRIDDLDIVDLPRAQREAKKAGVQLTVQRQRGPNGYPTVRLQGDPKRVRGLLKTWDMEDLYEEVGEATGYPKSRFPMRK